MTHIPNADIVVDLAASRAGFTAPHDGCLGFDTLSYDTLGKDFVVFRFDPVASNDILYIEIYEDALYPKSADVVHRYVELHSRLQRVALGPLESRNFISRLAREFAGNTT